MCVRKVVVSILLLPLAAHPSLSYNLLDWTGELCISEVSLVGSLLDLISLKDKRIQVHSLIDSVGKFQAGPGGNSHVLACLGHGHGFQWLQLSQQSAQAQAAQSPRPQLWYPNLFPVCCCILNLSATSQMQHAHQ